MKYLKKYNESIKSGYSIYQFDADLNSILWNTKKFNKSEIKKWTDHFVGPGWYDKISNRVEDMYNSLKAVDINYIKDRMIEVWDELPSGKKRYVIFSIVYGDYKRHDNKPEYKYNGLITVRDVNDLDRKYDIIIHIIRDIILPTMRIGTPGARIRDDQEKEFVTDSKWNCQNFNIDEWGFKDGDVLKNNDGGSRDTTTIWSGDLDEKRKYSPDIVLDMFDPAIVVEIGGYGDSPYTGKFKLSKIEPILDEVLEIILPDLDHSHVIWDKSRGNRRFEDDEFYDYTLKILLN